MYKSIHDIPIYNFTQCSLGNYSYMGFGLFRARRFEKMKKAMEMNVEVDERASDYAVKMNYASLMIDIDKLIRMAVFATDEQKEEILSIASPFGLSLDMKSNEEKIQRYVDKTVSEAPTKDDKKENPLDRLYTHATYMSSVLKEKIDTKSISAKEFIVKTKLADKLTAKSNG